MESMFVSAFTQLEESRILLQWLATVDGLSNYDMLDLKNIPQYDEYSIIETLQDGVCIAEALAMMEPTIFKKSQISYN